MRESLESQAIRLDLERNVDFLGALPQGQLPYFYRRSAASVFPFIQAADGDQEGLGLVVPEAQGCGCPVISTDLPAVRDLVESGVTGFLVRPGDSEALAKKIDDVLSLPAGERDELCAAARDHAVQYFNWPNIARKYADVLIGN